jgi:hypothetical protein
MRGFRTALGFALALPVITLAAPPGPAPASLYDVEVLVFENRLPELEGGELWSRDQTKSPPRGLAEAVVPADAPAADSTLAVTAQALDKDGHYRVLLHKRWQQGAEAKSETKPMRLTTSELDGTFRFTLTRFLYVDVDLLLRDAKGGDTGPRYRLTEHRRINLQEVHYLDHPKFGVLVRISQAGKG